MCMTTSSSCCCRCYCYCYCYCYCCCCYYYYYYCCCCCCCYSCCCCCSSYSYTIIIITTITPTLAAATHGLEAGRSPQSRFTLAPRRLWKIWNEDHSILGSTLGSPNFGKLPFRVYVLHGSARIQSIGLRLRLRVEGLGVLQNAAVPRHKAME